MSTRTSNWVSRTTPGAPPPPPSRAPTAAPPPTVYPESSVSNPNSSRYTGRPSRTAAPSHHSASSHRSRSASSHHTASSRHSASTHRMNTYYAPPQEPIVARTSSADGRTSSYMIIPARGQKVEILHPTTPARAATLPASASYYSSAHKEKPLIKRLFDKVEWGSGSGASKTSTARPPSRRHSTGTTIISGSGSGTRVTSTSGRVYQVHYA